LRAVGALAVALALWWMLLLDPLLAGLRISTELVMRLLPGDGTVAHATIGPDGKWVLQMPVPAFIGRLDSTQRIFGRVSKDTPMVRVRSLKVPVSGTYPVLFTVSLPFFWALWVAAPRGGSFLRGLLAGSGLLALAGVLSLVFYAIHTAVETLHLSPPGVVGFLLKSGKFVVTEALPYAGPLLLALWFHRGLQALVFSGTEAPRPAGRPERKAARTGRGRYR
jgi:hypothetical protein